LSPGWSSLKFKALLFGHGFFQKALLESPDWALDALLHATFIELFSCPTVGSAHNRPGFRARDLVSLGQASNRWEMNLQEKPSAFSTS
jgi:hypothetical protein